MASVLSKSTTFEKLTRSNVHRMQLHHADTSTAAGPLSANKSTVELSGVCAALDSKSISVSLLAASSAMATRPRCLMNAATAAISSREM